MGEPERLRRTTWRHHANSLVGFRKFVGDTMRGSRASQIATVSLPGSPAAGGTSRVSIGVRPASVEEAGDLLAGKAEPAMRELLAQKFLAVRGEIDDQQPPARPQRARRLAQRARGIVEEVQHLMDDDEIVGVALDRRRIDVALPQQRVAQPALVDARAGEREHRRALVDADGALGERREQFEHAAGAGAEIEQRADAAVADQGEDRRLDALLGRVHGADAVPVAGALGEIGGGLLAPRLARHFEPRAVGGQRRVVAVDARDQIARQRAAAFGEAEERPGAFALALGEPRVDEQLQMARDARLRLAEDGDELADRQFGLAEQPEQAQPRHFARRFEAREQGVEAHRRRKLRSALQIRHKHIFMYDSGGAQEGRPAVLPPGALALICRPHETGPPMTPLYDIDLDAIDGRKLKLSEYAGKVLLVVNVASRCGFTPQYEGLEALWRRYRDRGFAVLGFPCDQFGHQEPGDEAQIQAFCTQSFDVTFPLFAKIEVNGAGAHPLYRTLKAEAPGFLGTQAIKWNFTKFLLDRKGLLVRRYGPMERPETLTNVIEALLV